MMTTTMRSAKMSESKHTTAPSNPPANGTTKVNSAATATAAARRVNPNQSHLGLKAFIISASVLGTVAGWGVLASNQVGAFTKSSSLTQSNEPALPVQSDASRWVLPDALPNVLAQNDASDLSNSSNSFDRAPRPLPPSKVATDVNRARPSAAQGNATISAQPKIREVNVLPAPVQQRQPRAVARSRSSQ